MKNFTKAIITISLVLIVLASMSSSVYGKDYSYEITLENLYSEKGNLIIDIGSYEKELDWINASIEHARDYGDSDEVSLLSEKAKSISEVIVSLKKRVSEIRADIKFFENM